MASPVTTAIPCELCGAATLMLATKRCDGCWELETRVQAQPVLALKILFGVDFKSLLTWQCGCDHSNGFNLATCAACGRDPSGEWRGKPPV